MGVESLLWLFLVSFLIHEFEEIIFLGKFLSDNLERIRAKVPSKFIPKVDGLISHSQSQFAFAVFEEIIVLVVIIAFCLWFNLYSLFTAVVIAYELHVVFHIIQSFVIRMYVPAAGSGVISSVYCVFCIFLLHSQGMVSWVSVGIILPGVLVFIIVNIKFAYHLAAKLV